MLTSQRHSPLHLRGHRQCHERVQQLGLRTEIAAESYQARQHAFRTASAHRVTNDGERAFLKSKASQGSMQLRPESASANPLLCSSRLSKCYTFSAPCDCMFCRINKGLTDTRIALYSDPYKEKLRTLRMSSSSRKHFSIPTLGSLSSCCKDISPLSVCQTRTRQQGAAWGLLVASATASGGAQA